MCKVSSWAMFSRLSLSARATLKRISERFPGLRSRHPDTQARCADWTAASTSAGPAPAIRPKTSSLAGLIRATWLAVAGSFQAPSTYNLVGMVIAPRDRGFADRPVKREQHSFYGTDHRTPARPGSPDALVLPRAPEALC